MATCFVISILVSLLFHTVVAPYPNFSNFNINCDVDDTINITTTDVTNGYIQIFDSSCAPLPLESDDNITYYTEQNCHAFEANEQFLFLWSETEENRMPTVYSGNCETNNATLTSSTNVDGQASPLYYLNDEIKPVLELTVPSTVRLGSRFTVNVRLSEDSKDFFFILLNYVKIIYGADSTYVVEDGCDDEDFVAFFSYDGDIFSGPVASTYTTVELDLFIPGTRIDSDTIILTIEVQAKICPSEYASACAPVECSKRRRRQIDEQQTASAKTSVVVFLEEESRQKFQENMRKELGLVDAASTKSEEDLCVNKTTSAVVLVILIAGMVLCLMATCWMFIKMRKSRRSESSGKSEFAFSNKSVKY